MRLYTIWRGWLSARFANQITLFAVSLTLGVALLMGAGSYLALRAQIETAIESGLATQTQLIERRLSHNIQQTRAKLDSLSRNSLIVNGLLDSSGRDAYLRPFLRDFRLDLPGREDTALTLYDFVGKPLIQLRPDPVSAADAEVIGQAIATGKLQARIIMGDNQPYLKLVQPVYFPPTQSVEGALSERIQLAPLLANTGIALAEGQLLQLHAAGAVLAQSGASGQDVLRVERALKLDAPFDTLGLRLTLDSSTREAHDPLDRLTLIYGVGLLLLLPLVGWLAHRSSRRLVAPLGQLSATAEAITRSGVITLPLHIGGSNEVGRLADAFSEMLARLDAAQAALRQLNEELETKVAARTAELSQFKNTLDQTLEAVYIVDPESLLFTYVNQGAIRQTGYSETELMQMTPVDFNQSVVTLETFKQFVQPLITGVQPSLTFQSVQRHKDGHDTPVEIFLQLVHPEGQAPSFVAMASDITARRQAEATLRESEQTLQLMLDAAHFGYWNLNLVTHAANRSLRHDQIFGYEELLADWTYEKFLTHVHSDDRAQVNRLFQAGVAAKTEWDFECRITRRDGALHWIWAHGNVYTNAAGEPDRMVGMVSDITERKQAEEEIRQLNVNLEQRVLERTNDLAVANQELEAFSYSVSHDLRAPLRAMDGFSQALLEDYADKLDDQGKDYLQRVRNATQRMGQLIDDMLTLSRVTRTAMRRETIDLGALAAAVIAELQRSEPERKVDWRIEPDLIAQGDAGLLRIVLVNLLGNAWKFTGKTANAKIEFGAASVPDAGNAEGMTAFFVRDNGAGYDMAYADTLFGAFQRLHPVSDFPGTGIGLTLVQRILHRHGGRVWAEGAVGQGATFYFTL